MHKQIPIELLSKEGFMHAKSNQGRRANSLEVRIDNFSNNLHAMLFYEGFRGHVLAEIRRVS